MKNTNKYILVLLLVLFSGSIYAQTKTVINFSGESVMKCGDVFYKDCNKISLSSHYMCWSSADQGDSANELYFGGIVSVKLAYPKDIKSIQIVQTDMCESSDCTKMEIYDLNGNSIYNDAPVKIKLKEKLEFKNLENKDIGYITFNSFDAKLSAVIIEYSTNKGCTDEDPDDDKDCICNSEDVCNGFDDLKDKDFDKIPDGCDICYGNNVFDDKDNDGICADLDCDDEDPFLKAKGFDCDDNDKNTINDKINNLCECKGLRDPCKFVDCDDGDACTEDICFDIYDGEPICENIPSPDSDKDSYCDLIDNCKKISNRNQADKDKDGIGDLCDNCIDRFNKEQLDQDNDGLGDACDFCFGDNKYGDTDKDGICDDLDNYLSYVYLGGSIGDGIYQAGSVLVATGEISKTTNAVTFKSGDTIVLQGGFKADPTLLFDAIIEEEGCEE